MTSVPREADAVQVPALHDDRRSRILELENEGLAHEISVLREQKARDQSRIDDLESERNAYCEIAHEAIHKLQAITQQLERARTTIAALREALRQASEGSAAA